MNRDPYIPFFRDGMWYFATPGGGLSAGFRVEQAAHSAADYCRRQDNLTAASRALSHLRRGNPRNH